MKASLNERTSFPLGGRQGSNGREHQDNRGALGEYEKLDNIEKFGEFRQ